MLLAPVSSPLHTPPTSHSHTNGMNGSSGLNGAEISGEPSMSKPISQHNLSHPPPANKSQKQMTKAERREMQEAQRAAKAAKTAAGGGSQQGGGGKTTGVKQAQQQLSNSSTAQQKKGGRGEGVGSTKGGVVVTAATTGKIGKGESSKAAAAGSEIAIGRSRGLRIFSHFALQKTQSHVPKGDIHPAIARLGLKFAEFKICGANARCIATLSAFKEVSVFRLFFFFSSLGRS